MQLFSDSGPSKARRHTAAVILTVILAAIIAALTLSPLDVPVDIGSDKLHHLIAFAALTLPCAVLYRRLLAVLAPMAILYGGLIELIQPSVGRHGEWRDFGADVIGVGLGVGVGLSLRLILTAWANRSSRSAETAGEMKN